MSESRRTWLWLGAAIVGVTLLALPILTYPLGRDQGEFATIGRGLLDGRAPYVDLWNPKPPAVFYLYALAMTLFGQTAAALRALDLLFVPVIMIAVGWLGHRLACWRVGVWAALLFGVFYFTETFWTLTQNDGLALLPMVLTLVATVKAADNGRLATGWAFAAGLLFAATLWFKYPFGLLLLPVGVGYITLRTRSSATPQGHDASDVAAVRDPPTQNNHVAFGRRGVMSRRDLINVAAFIAGTIVVGGGGALYLLQLGALTALIESATVTSQYTALGIGEFGAALANYAAFRWQQWDILLGLSLLAVIFISRVTDQPRRWRFVLVWLVAAALMMLVQAKGYDYHWLPLLPPLALLGGATLAGLAGEITRLLGGRAWLPRTVIAVGLGAVLFNGVWGDSLPYLLGRESQADYYARFQGGEFVAAESHAVTQYLRDRTTPGDSLFIWGFRPEVYYLSDLRPATRFIFQFPLVGEWYPAAWQQENVDVLWAALPPYVLVLQVDYMPWVTGRDADSNTLLQDYTELNNWLIFNYEQETQIGNFFVWRRKTP